MIEKLIFKFITEEPVSKTKFVYEIKPTNFDTLPDDKKMVALTKYLSILKSIQKPIRIIMLSDSLEVDYGGETKLTRIPRTYVVSPEPLEQVLQEIGTEYSMATTEPTWKVKREELSHLVLEDGSLAKCYTLYKIPGSLAAAWAHNLLPSAEMVSIYFKPIESHIAVSTINRYVGLVGAAAAKSASALNKYQMATDLLNKLTRQQTSLLTCSVVVMLRATDLFGLKEAEKKFKIAMRTMLSSFEPAKTIQKQMLESGIGKKLFFELGSSSIFYPFVSADMIEVPNGVPIGINNNTGAPVIYDYTQRDNYNILLLATSGAGKSVTAKTLLTRLVDKYPTSHVFIVDPNGEYETVANYLNIPIIKVTEEKNLGFDPFKLFKPEDAADIVGDVSKADEITRKEFRAKADGCKSIKELYEKVDTEAKKYLADLVSGATKDILEGESKFSDRIAISLRGTSGEERISMLLLFALGKVWKKINSLPVHVPKVLLIDEGWMLFNMASAGKFLDMMARVGRKFNVIFMFITQRPEDVIDNPFGRAIAENAATKIFLQNTEQASEKIKNVMDLSDQEADMLKTFRRGQCLFLTKDHRLRVQITPSAEELKIFSTTPMDMVEP